MEQRIPGPAAAQHFGVEGVGEPQHAARLGRLADAQMRPDLVRARQHPLDQNLDRAAAGLAAEQPRLDDAGVVEDQQVARLQQARQLAEHAVDPRVAATVEQARAAALGGGMLGDQLGRQREVEVGEAVAEVGERHGRQAGPA